MPFEGKELVPVAWSGSCPAKIQLRLFGKNAATLSWHGDLGGLPVLSADACWVSVEIREYYIRMLPQA